MRAIGKTRVADRLVGPASSTGEKRATRHPLQVRVGAGHVVALVAAEGDRGDPVEAVACVGRGNPLKRRRRVRCRAYGNPLGPPRTCHRTGVVGVNPVGVKFSRRGGSFGPGQSRQRRLNRCSGRGSLAYRRDVRRAHLSQAGDPSGFSALQETPAGHRCRCWRRFLMPGLQKRRSRCHRRARCVSARCPLVRFAEPHRHAVPYRSVHFDRRPTMTSSPRHRAAVAAWLDSRVGKSLFLALRASFGRDGGARLPAEIYLG